MDKDALRRANGSAWAGAKRVEGGLAGGALFNSEFKLWAYNGPTVRGATVR